MYHVKENPEIYSSKSYSDYKTNSSQIGIMNRFFLTLIFVFLSNPAFSKTTSPFIVNDDPLLHFIEKAWNSKLSNKVLVSQLKDFYSSDDLQRLEAEMNRSPQRFPIRVHHHGLEILSEKNEVISRIQPVQYSPKEIIVNIDEHPTTFSYEEKLRSHLNLLNQKSHAYYLEWILPTAEATVLHRAALGGLKVVGVGFLGYGAKRYIEECISKKAATDVAKGLLSGDLLIKAYDRSTRAVGKLAGYSEGTFGEGQRGKNFISDPKLESCMNKTLSEAWGNMENEAGKMNESIAQTLGVEKEYAAASEKAAAGILKLRLWWNPEGTIVALGLDPKKVSPEQIKKAIKSTQ
ncbi:MAG: hypothetical protein KDD34_01375 [Bdellovibrionales bacterium]|nr:hypothetical protein [Bdellovibrionales bacterium]